MGGLRIVCGCSRCQFDLAINLYICRYFIDGGGEEVLTSESARISGLPAAIARSPAVTVRNRSSCASREYVDRVLLVARELCGRAGGGGS